MIQNKLGNFGEDIALKYLTFSGYQLLERNFRSIYGEIDLILKNKDTLVFVEVKTVTRDAGYEPIEQMTPRKLSHIKNTINGYLSFRHIPPKQAYRLDFVGIIIDKNGIVHKIDHRISVG